MNSPEKATPKLMVLNVEGRNKVQTSRVVCAKSLAVSLAVNVAKGQPPFEKWPLQMCLNSGFVGSQRRDLNP
jgi:hypothetical protein